MCEYIWNGFKASMAKKKKVDNEVLLRKLDERIEQLSEEGGGGEVLACQEGYASGCGYVS